MKRFKAVIEIEYDEVAMYGTPETEGDEYQTGVDWFYNKVLSPSNLTIYSSEIGDDIGLLTKFSLVTDKGNMLI